LRRFRIPSPDRDHRLIEITGTTDRLPPIGARSESPESREVTTGIDEPDETAARRAAAEASRVG
jgi:hypothetical protein